MSASLTYWLKSSRRLVFLFAATAVCAGIAFGQAQSNAADLQGVVRDPKGAAISGATVTARNTATNLSRTTTTDGDGVYQLINLPPGDYEVTAEAPGFSKARIPSVTLTVGQKADLEVLSTDECKRLLQAQRMGRIALVVDGRPHILPVNYVFDEGAVVFRTSAGLKLERGPLTEVAFETDDVDRRRGVAWSVMVQGTAHHITDTLDPLSRRLRDLPVEPAAPGARLEWLAVYADHISGRRFKLPPA